MRRNKEREIAVGLYMPMIRQYVPDLDDKKMKETVKQAGGSVNQSGLFLAPTSKVGTVTSGSGVNRRSVISPPLSPPSRSEDSLFQALTSLKHHNDFLWIKFKIATFLRQATDAQLQRIADWHSMTLQKLRARASYIAPPDAWGTCTDIHVYASMTETSIRVREGSNRTGRYNPIDREGNAIEDSIVLSVIIVHKGLHHFNVIV